MSIIYTQPHTAHAFFKGTVRRVYWKSIISFRIDFHQTHLTDPLPFINMMISRKKVYFHRGGKKADFLRGDHLIKGKEKENGQGEKLIIKLFFPVVHYPSLSFIFLLLLDDGISHQPQQMINKGQEGWPSLTALISINQPSSFFLKSKCSRGEGQLSFHRDGNKPSPEEHSLLKEWLVPGGCKAGCGRMVSFSFGRMRPTTSRTNVNW